MPTKDMNKRDAKIVQYLNDAYATERRLEIALQGHIAMTPRADYKKALREHLRETKAHARSVARRIKALGGEAETVSLPGPDSLAKGATGAKAAVQRAAAAAQAPLHAVRGTGQQERMLKNARTEYQDEAGEIATYRAIEALAKAVGDKETAKLAREIGREEKRMADFLVGIIDQLALDVVHDEVPVSEIRAPAARAAHRRQPRGRQAARHVAGEGHDHPRQGEDHARQGQARYAGEGGRPPEGRGRPHCRQAQLAGSAAAQAAARMLGPGSATTSRGPSSAPHAEHVRWPVISPPQSRWRMTTGGPACAG
jgi:ferritin-like metal-binding protein YciE